MSRYQHPEGLGADLGDSYQRWLDESDHKALLRDMIAHPWLYDAALDETGRDHPELHPGVSVPCPDTEKERENHDRPRDY